MLRTASFGAILLLACASTTAPVAAQSASATKGGWMALPAQGMLPTPSARIGGGGFGALPFAAGSSRYCDIVVKRGGGNPTQDMTGSIGHAKSYQAGGGGPARQRVCSR